MSIEPGDYGIVKITKGKLKGRIGYYDDDAYHYPENVLPEDEDEDEDIQELAIVYFGMFIIAQECYEIPHEFLARVSMHDLMKRKDELFPLCLPYLTKGKPNYKKISGFLSELHLVETTLLEKIVEQRYVNKPSGSKVFISHSSFDKPFAKLLCMDLEANGYRPWLDEWDIKVGESIPEKISSGLRDADFVIVILSENAVSSKWVEREWQTKYWNEIEKGCVNVLPVLLKDCDIPELLRTKKYADFRKDFNMGLDDLLTALEYLSHS